MEGNKKGMTDRIRCSSCGAESFADGATLYCKTCYDKLKVENERLEAGWMEFESITLDGKLRPSVKDLLRALEDARTDIADAIMKERKICAAICEQRHDVLMASASVPYDKQTGHDQVVMAQDAKLLMRRILDRSHDLSNKV